MILKVTRVILDGQIAPLALQDMLVQVKQTLDKILPVVMGRTPKWELPYALYVLLEKDVHTESKKILTPNSKTE